MLTHAHSHQAIDPPDHATVAERGLAAKVIHQAILDLTSNPPQLYRGQSNNDYLLATQRWDARVRESYEFLTGAGAMSAFWFNALELPFLSGTPEAVRARLA